MARNLPISTIQNICSPEWIAQTYSEYMLDCANSQLELVNQATEACSNEDLDDVIEQCSNTFHNVQNQLLDIFNRAKGEFNIQTVALNFNDPEVIRVLGEILESDSPDLAPYKYEIIDELRTLGALSDEFDTDLDKMLESEISFDDLVNTYDATTFASTANDVQTLISTIKTQTSTNLNINLSSFISLDNGFASLDQILDALIRDVNGLSLPEINLKDSLGAAISSVKLESADIFSQLKASASSCLAWGIGFAATAKQSLSDKLTYYEAQIKAFISDTTESFASTVNTVRMTLAEAGDNIRSFFDMADEQLGLSDIANDVVKTADDTDVFSYTGASPWSSFSTKGAQGALAAIGKAAVGVATGVFMAAKALLTKLWNKVKPWVKAITDDPVDIGTCDEGDKSYTCSTFSYHGENQYMELTGGPNFTTANPSDPYLTLTTKIGKWITIDTFLGVIQFKINSVSGSLDHARRGINYDWVVKPKCLNYRSLIDYGIVSKAYPASTPVYGDSVTLHIGSFNSESTYFKTQWMQFLASDAVYPSNDEDEKYIYMGFKVASAMLYSIMAQTADDIYNMDRSDYPAGAWYAVDGFATDIRPDNHSQYTPQMFPVRSKQLYIYTRDMVADTDDWWVPDSVNNLDFVKVVSGYATYDSTTHFDVIKLSSTYPQEMGNNNYYYSMNYGIAYLIYTFVAQQADRALFPSEYLFLPYYNNSYVMPGGRYRIKTDADNSNVVSIVMNALIVVAAIVAVIVIGKTIVKIFKRKKIAKLSQKVGVMDNAMWNGKKLSTKDAWNYTRYKQKLERISQASTGLAGSGSAVGNLTKAVKDVQSFMIGNSVSEAGNSSENSLNVGCVIHLIKG